MDYTQLIEGDPQEIAEHMQLKYIERNKLSILRIKEKEKFQYIYKNKPLKKKKEINRIEKLVIPPAWQEVRIASISNAHLQAVGYDLKKRLQYRYHDLWLKVRNRTKFSRMAQFGEALPAIRKKVDEDLQLTGWPKDKVLALIIRLMEETHIRIGNEQYAKRNKTYGLSTLRTRHLKTTKNKLKFEFTGKKGKKHSITLNNKRLRRLVLQCEEIPGWELFQFYDEDGIKTGVESGMVNEYLQRISGQMFTAKDFRTWAGTIIFFESLAENEPTDDEAILKKNIISAFDRTADALGNTRNVCRKYYVHPFIVKEYEEKRLFKTLRTIDSEVQKEYQTAAEQVLLGCIQRYDPFTDLKKTF
ncbi:DNA topoisomerase IB [Maribacter sp. MAR_2009_72]|uniref:DNA topoisomerase IB n=1 Tax=Maribacter sp. MAR_2009_72 TaxID=1250050 RepID=UPI00119C8DC3|nr:DNA topoisomerase IB [Maribacter sp. MAR_2009_72]TVZ16053.1 DNA topoisomerase-1 [Maribacter sp. MAR_2009_72]